MTHEAFETTSFSIDLTGAEISTILYYLEWKVWELNEVGLEEDIAPEIERIFTKLRDIRSTSQKRQRSTITSN